MFATKPALPFQFLTRSEKVKPIKGWKIFDGTTDK